MIPIHRGQQYQHVLLEEIHMAPPNAPLGLVNYTWITDLKVVAIKMACEAAATV
jgi:hypothetical protein